MCIGIRRKPSSAIVSDSPTGDGSLSQRIGAEQRASPYIDGTRLAHGRHVDPFTIAAFFWYDRAGRACRVSAFLEAKNRNFGVMSQCAGPPGAAFVRMRGILEPSMHLQHHCHRSSHIHACFEEGEAAVNQLARPGPSRNMKTQESYNTKIDELCLLKFTALLSMCRCQRRTVCRSIPVCEPGQLDFAARAGALSSFGWCAPTASAVAAR